MADDKPSDTSNSRVAQSGQPAAGQSAKEDLSLLMDAEQARARLQERPNDYSVSPENDPSSEKVIASLVELDEQEAFGRFGTTAGAFAPDTVNLSGLETTPQEAGLELGAAGLADFPQARTSGEPPAPEAAPRLDETVLRAASPGQDEPAVPSREPAASNLSFGPTPQQSGAAAADSAATAVPAGPVAAAAGTESEFPGTDAPVIEQSFRISDVSDADPAANTLAEDAAAGTTVGITAFATDGNSRDTVSYFVDDSRFTIDPDGTIRVADGAAVDAESEASIDITVTATSSDGSSSQQSFTVSVGDVNESAVSAISDTDASANAVNENAAIGTSVGITAFASDSDATDTVTYSLSDDAGGLFAIDAVTGEVTVAGNLDAEAADSRTIEVTATSSDGSTATQSYTIAVNDQDEFDISAVTDTDASTNAVDENAAAGTAVGITVLGTDADATDTVGYSVDDSRFTIDPDGTVRVAPGAAFDAESEASIDFTVTATSSDGSSSQQSFTVSVGDVNESAVSAISDRDAAANAVEENAAIGTSVGITAFASDSDATDTVTYSLSDDAGGLFAIDAVTGEVTVVGNLDAEAAASRTIEVTATSSDGSTATQSYTIAVNDQDEFDISAVTDTDASANAVDENAAIGTSVGITAFASDGDATDVVSYSLSDDAGGLFAIDAVTGEVTVAGNIDAEAAASHTIEVAATSSDGSTATQSYTIAINDLDEFEISTVSDTDASANAVDENAAIGASVGITAFASDADVTDTVSYSLSDDAGGLFTIDAVTGEVNVAGELDAEAATSHTIEVTATSSDGSTATQSYTIAINDLDEFDISAVTDTDASANTIAENAAAGTAVGITALATDGDVTDTVGYAVDDSRFTIDPDGTVRVADGASFDAESEASIDITVTATSSDGSSSQQTFTLSVGDVNESAVSAISDTDAAANAVEENAAIGTSVGITAFASDGDATDTVTYSLSDDAGGLFAIDAVTGEVTVAGDLDYETADSHIIEVTATSTDGSTRTQSFTVAISDMNEFSVSATVDTDGTANRVAENAATGTVVGITAHASDADGSNNTVTYSLVDADGNAVVGGAFAIDANTGVVTVADGTQLDYENAASQTIYVKSTSSDGSSSVSSFSIDVTDVAEAPPTDMTFGGNDALAISGDTIAANTAVGQVLSVEDADAGDTFTFQLTDDAGGKFAIDPDSGTIRLVAEHDATSAYSDTVTVEVTDSGGNTYSETIGIHLGTTGNDTITGTGYTDIMYGDAGADTLDGGDGDDIIYGGEAGYRSIGASGTVGSTFSLIRLATGVADVDPNEDDGVSENAASLLGTYGSSGSPLYDQIVSAQSNDTNGDGRIEDNDQHGSAETLTIDGTDYALDSTQEYSATVTFTDGTTGTFTAVVIQMADGQVYLAPEFESNADAALLSSKAIESITLDSVTVNDADLYANRHDTDYARPSGDTIYGGAGNDTIYGSDGDDHIETGEGDDVVYAGDGDDFIDEAIGENDGTGNDEFHGGDGNDTIYGGDDNDALYGDAGNDWLDGEVGDDLLFGGAGTDVLFGREDNDTLVGGTGDDYLIGGDGSDIFAYALGDGNDAVYGGAGGGWTDVIDMSADSGIGDYGTDWTMTITQGSIESVDMANGVLDLSDDAAGSIQLSDGSQITFQDIEQIQW